MAGARPAGRMPFMPDPTLNRLRPALRACHHLEQGGFDWFGLVVFSLEASSEISSLACATFAVRNASGLFSLLGLSFYRSAFDLLTL
jgi:hypothetical protein